MVLYTKRCFGFELSRTFDCTLEGAGDTTTINVKATSMLIHWSSGKALQALQILPYMVMESVDLMLVGPRQVYQSAKQDSL